MANIILRSYPVLTYYLKVKKVYRSFLTVFNRIERDKYLYLWKKPDRNHPLYFLWDTNPEEINSWIFHGESIKYLWEVLAKHQPKSIIEIGSGLSTVVFAVYAKTMQVHHEKTVKILSIEHDEQWALKTRSRLQEHGLDQLVCIKTCPIVESSFLGYFGKTYSLDRLEDASFDFALIDGPPGNIGRLLTVLSIPSLVERGSVIIVDDIDRKPEFDSLRLAEKLGLIRIQELSPVGNGLGILEKI
jgi:predicted O-methyltransferase YrrM